MKTSVHQTTILCDNRNKDQDIFLIIDQIDTLYHVRRSTKENNSLIILHLILYIIILMIVLITDMIMSKVEIPKGRRIIFASSAPHLG